MSALTGGGTGLPPYYTGKYMLEGQILPLTMSGSGGFTKGSLGSLITEATFEYVRFRLNTNSEDIHPANLTVANEVIIFDEYTVEVGEIQLANTANNVVRAAWGGADYFLITTQDSPDGGTTVDYIQSIVSRGSLDLDFERGKSVNAAIFKAAGQKIWVGTTPQWT